MRRLTSALLAVTLCWVSGSVGSGRALAGPDDDMEFAPEATQGGPPSKTLQRGKDLYEKGDFYSASIELMKVISKETDDDEANRQNAEFFMGKTLYQMGFYAASLAYFDAIVTAGPAHSFHTPTLKWLAALSRVLPETSNILDRIGTYDAAAFDNSVYADVKDELLYLLGRHFYNKADFEKAIGLFQQVSRESPHFIKAKFFEGVTYVRKYEGKPAVEAFKEILVIGKERPKWYTAADIELYNELATLQMARVFYSVQQYDDSIRYYEKLDSSSPDWLPSLFEASWAYFMKTGNSKALGNIHTLNAPYFETEFFPESILLKSVIYYKYCLYDRALEAVGEYDQTYRSLRQNVKDALAKEEDNAEFFEYVKKIRAGKGGLDEATERLILSVLGDKTLGKTFNWVDELTKELAMLEKADPAWQTTAIAGRVLQELTLQESLARIDAGKLARERIERLLKELQEFGRDGIKIKIEVLNAKAGQITAEAKGDRISGDHEAERIVVDDEHFMWKFNGEYWKDELGYYRFKIQSRCPKQQ